MDQLTGEERHDSYIIHYAGVPDTNFVLSLIPKDIAKWEEDSPAYEYQKHICVDVQGGLGDQVDAEPSVRFMKKHIYPDDDIVVITHFPRLFQHLDVDVHEHGAFTPEPDTPYHKRLSLPGPSLMQWAIVSNLMCHTVDYCSMALLKRTLPMKDRTIRLEVTQEDMDNLRAIMGDIDLTKLVLIHPGRHWESKTFPDSWWQEVIDGIRAAGLPVCIMGKQDYLRGTDTIERGTVDLEIREGMVDTRTLLDLGAFIALISQGRILLSNDSSPIHIAGAFNNHIILIPTCKHPDHLLPYRRRSISYKAIALYQKLTIDDVNQQPTATYGTSGECVDGDILDYLPEPDTVIQTVIEKYNGWNICI